MDIKKIFAAKAYKYTIRTLIILLNLLFFIPVTVIFASSLRELYFCKGSASNKIITIPKNQTFRKIARNLEDAEVIASWKQFYNWMVRYGWDRKIRSGRFHFTDDLSLFEVMNRICNGEEYLEKITISEGLRVEQVAAEFAKAGLNPDEFRDFCYDRKFIDSLGLHEESLEGFLFPDTYRISYDEKPKNVIQMMVKRFFTVTDDMNYKQSAIFQRAGLRKCMVIASLIEKETPYDPERKIISSVFWNRVKDNWRLDSDVTVRYALKKWQGKLTRKDLKCDSPYNTRRFKGLPPGPICNPGRESLKAAFFPDETPYMFFVASGSKKGDSIFSETLKEHSKTVKRLRKEGLI